MNTVERRIMSIVVLALSILMMVVPAAAGADESGYSVLSTPELADLHARDVWDFIIYDARNPGEYEEVHIKGALSLPQKNFDEHLGQLPSDKDVKIIFYCNGVKCGKSKKAAKKALEHGHSNVFVYAEGMPVWEEKGLPIYKGPAYEKKIQTTIISPDDLAKLVSAGADGVIVVDVRDAEEYQAGHIPGAINIPEEGFASASDRLDKNKKIVVYCNSGGRSYQAYRKLMKLGYENIAQAIFADWKSAGNPVQ